MALSRGTALVLVGVGLFIATMAVGAVTAPDREIGGDGQATPATPVDPERTATADPSETGVPAGRPATERRRTLVGVQGGWVTHGKVLMFERHDVVWRETTADGYFDVTWLEDGTVLAAFANESVTENCDPYEPLCARTGYRVIDPDARGGPEIIAEYSYATKRITKRETHAVDVTDDGGIVFTDMDTERIVLVKNDTEVWEWRASSFYDTPVDPTGRDWLHINDVDVIGDGRFLVSVRNANQILVIERGEGVVEVINKDRDDSDDEACTADPELDDFDGDGDVRCGDPDVMSHQHNPQWLGDGAVLVADSDNDRVVELHRTDDGTWEPMWAVHEANDRRLHWPRDADRLPNGNTLITDSLNKRIVEVTPEGEAVWGVGTERIPYDADRLPYGEAIGGYEGIDRSTPMTTSNDSPTADRTPASGRTPLPKLTANNPEIVNKTGREIPLLSLAVAGLTPMTPFWFGELHLGMSLVALAFVVAGVGDHVRKRYRE